MRLSCLLLCCLSLSGQSFTQRGFFETRNYVYPQTAQGDSGRLVSEELLRWEPSWKPRPWIQVNGGLTRVPVGVSISEMLGQLGLDARKVAVERNLAIVPRSTFGDVRVEEGDAYEIVYFVGGG